jgi:hypothetical protein
MRSVWHRNCSAVPCRNTRLRVQDRRVPEEFSAFAEDNKRFFTERLPGRDEPIGEPGGAMGFGAAGVDTTLVAGYSPRG